MSRIKRYVSWFIVLSAFGVSFAYADPLTLTLNPLNGALSGVAGQTVGWGFTLTNTSSDFAVITSADFCGSVISSPCTTALGSFTDFIAQFNFTMINPHSSLTDAFNLANHKGMGGYAISPSAPAGTFLGQVVLTYDTFAGDSLSNQTGSDIRLTSAASISVFPQQVPEIDSLWLLPIAFAGLYCLFNGLRERGRLPVP